MSVASKIDICNLALDHLGVGSIQVLTENNPRAEACDRHYATARDTVLRALKPPCCQERQADLAQLTADPAFGYTYAFQLPSDCIFVLETQDPDIYYSIEGRKLLSDDAEIHIRYIARSDDPTQYDEGTVQAIAALLAWHIAETLTGSVARKREMRAIYRDALAEARGDAHQESGPEDREEHFSWLEAVRAG